MSMSDLLSCGVLLDLLHAAHELRHQLSNLRLGLDR
jgi:hypothetical protein